MTTAIGWKVLNEDGSAHHGGSGRWPLPTKNPDGSWTPGEWMTAPGPLRLCESGTLHLCRSTRQVLEWLGPAIYHVEYDPNEALLGDNKIGVLRARLIARNEHWTEEAARLFAADCAEDAARVTGINAETTLRVVRRFAFGMVGEGELASARESAWASSLASARESARASAWASARESAWASALASVRASAWASVRASARESAKKKQTKRLHAYLTGAVDLDAIRRSVA